MSSQEMSVTCPYCEMYDVDRFDPALQKLLDNKYSFSVRCPECRKEGYKKIFYVFLVKCSVCTRLHYYSLTSDEFAELKDQRFYNLKCKSGKSSKPYLLLRHKCPGDPEYRYLPLDSARTKDLNKDRLLCLPKGFCPECDEGSRYVVLLSSCPNKHFRCATIGHEQAERFKDGKALKVTCRKCTQDNPTKTKVSYHWFYMECPYCGHGHVSWHRFEATLNDLTQQGDGSLQLEKCSNKDCQGRFCYRVEKSNEQPTVTVWAKFGRTGRLSLRAEQALDEIKTLHTRAQNVLDHNDVLQRLANKAPLGHDDQLSPNAAWEQTNDLTTKLRIGVEKRFSELRDAINYQLDNIVEKLEELYGEDLRLSEKDAVVVRLDPKHLRELPAQLFTSEFMRRLLDTFFQRSRESVARIVEGELRAWKNNQAGNLPDEPHAAVIVALKRLLTLFQKPPQPSDAGRQGSVFEADVVALTEAEKEITTKLDQLQEQHEKLQNLLQGLEGQLDAGLNGSAATSPEVAHSPSESSHGRVFRFFIKDTYDGDLSKLLKDELNEVFRNEADAIDRAFSQESPFFVDPDSRKSPDYKLQRCFKSLNKHLKSAQKECKRLRESQSATDASIPNATLTGKSMTELVKALGKDFPPRDPTILIDKYYQDLGKRNEVKTGQLLLERLPDAFDTLDWELHARKKQDRQPDGDQDEVISVLSALQIDIDFWLKGIGIERFPKPDEEGKLPFFDREKHILEKELEVETEQQGGGDDGRIAEVVQFGYRFVAEEKAVLRKPRVNKYVRRIGPDTT